ncbi:HpcH/HpaI aldolase/citrate lyase family protein [Pontivivens insulae]|uniref:(3S)-malyl-CoA thioesterase n=1 Tax=Pontivivens insulae TaxID=1639689 RepID=A0A2R8ADA1_9RHOB|nr:CoA ester lyase [Pontivivens insulae]RED14140.1 (3S)-malyl-CoA thioesterase [Pontivivens insulae]SPF30216.1 (3S)-malyl-CoA thioesterase [Pontivivens insulae]
MTESRPRRSVLYMPGSKQRALEKAATLPADALILDLEDAVAPAEKVAARDLVCETVKGRPFGAREVIIRVNGSDTEWGADDLLAAAAAAPDAILIPKVNSPEDIAAARSVAGDIAIWAMMETPLGILNAAQIAAAPGLTCMVMGTNDLVKDLHAAHTPDRLPLITSLGQCLLAARAHGLAIVDGVYNAFKDDEGLRASCLQGRDMGFDGKTLIHPLQLAITNEVFAPSAAALEEAEAQVTAFEEATAKGEAVAVVNGRIVENLHVENARRLLAEAAAIAKLEQQAA